MRTKIFTLIVLLLSLCCYSTASAQFREGDVRLYIPAGEDIDEHVRVSFVIKTGGELYVLGHQEVRFVKSRGSDKYDDFFDNANLIFHRMGYNMSNSQRLNYVPELSTSVRNVYRQVFVGHPLWGSGPTTYYYAFSKNGNSFIYWTEGNEANRSYYTEIDKSELMSKPVNYDFLYE